MRMPRIIEDEILKFRSHIRKRDNEIREKSGGKSGLATKPEFLDQELEFWNISNDEDLESFLMEDLVAAMYLNENIDVSQLPAGYVPLMDVLEFERHCMFEGWSAVSNKGDDMRDIISAYRFVGLSDEAKALEAVAEKYEVTPDDTEDFHDILGAAYGSVANSTPEVEDRIQVILEFVRKNPKLFAELA